MREPTPEIVRGVSARLSRPPAAEPEALAGPGRPDRYVVEGGPAGQHFDIFAREPEPRSAGWVVCWSDLMMTMFIMFAALYVFQAPQIQFKSVTELAAQAVPIGAEPAPPRSLPGSILDRIHDRLRDLIERDGLQAWCSVRSMPEKSLHVVLAGDLLFDGGGAALRAEGRTTLRGVAEILRAAPHTLAVVGHAGPGEALPGFRGPWELSVARAGEVAGYLMREAGLPSERMLVVGYGDQRPVSGDGGASRSRRVELVLSAENPTEPLPGDDAPAADGFRGWLANSKRGGE